MSELQVIETMLRQAASRRRWARALTGLGTGLLIGALLSLLLVGFYHLRPLPLWTLLVASAVPLVSMLSGMLVRAFHQTSLKDTARWVDVRQHLHERVSTALELASDPKAGEWQKLVVADAAARVARLDQKRLVPFLLPKKSLRWALALLAMTAGLGFVPEYRSKTALKKQADEENIKAIGKQLADLTRHDLQQRPPVLEPTQKAMDAVAT